MWPAIMLKRLTSFKRIIFVLAALLAIIASVPALAYEDGEYVGNVGIVLKSQGEDRATACECTLGAAAADAVRDAADTDIAVICGGSLLAGIRPGECRWEDIQAAVKPDIMLGAAEITPRELAEFLEAGVRQMKIDSETHYLDYEASYFDGFPQISGFTLEYDMSAKPGERIYSIRLEDGTYLDLQDGETKLTLAAPVNILEGGYGYPARSYTALSISEDQALAGYIAAGGITDQFDGLGRIAALGTNNNSIMARYPKTVILIIIALLLVTVPIRLRKLQLRRDSIDGKATD